MGIEKGKISNSQLIFLITGFVQGSALTVGFVINITKQDTWLVVLSGTLLVFVMIWIYLNLAERFPGKNLIQINNLIYGPYLGTGISSLYLYWFLSLIAQHLRYMGDFFLASLMTETPMVAILIPFTFICVWATRKGIEVIARTSIILVSITMISNLVIICLLLKNIKLSNFLPVFELSMKDFIQGTNIILTITYSDLLAFLMVVPYVNKPNKMKKSVFLGLTLGAMTIFYVTIQSIAVLGVTMTIWKTPFLEAVRLIDVAKIFTRLEMLVAFALLITVFLKVSVLLYATELSIAQMFNLRSYIPLGIPVGIICICLAIRLFESTVEQFYWGLNIWPIIALPFEVLLPAISLLIAKIRKLPQEKGGGS
ncbi:GerAB/ArcD/ProY family transporter [Desulfosporosinus fructosivorans]